RTRARWHLTGFMLSTAAIAAIHSGVLIPLVLLCIAASAAAERLRDVGRAAVAGAVAVAEGSTWMIGFLFYRRVVTPDSRVGSTALYYFPFLRPFAGDAPRETAYMMLTPFLMTMFAVAAIVAIRGWRRRDAYAMFAGGAAVLFIVTHAASAIGIPEIVEVRRNASWLAMAIAIVIGVASTTFRVLPPIALAAWLIT